MDNTMNTTKAPKSYTDFREVMGEDAFTMTSAELREWAARFARTEPVDEQFWDAVEFQCAD